MRTFEPVLTALFVAAMFTANGLMPASALENAPLAVSLKDGVVSPNRLNVPADAVIKITVTNDGSSTAEFESKTLHIEKVVAAGAQITVTLRNLAPGEYEFVDEYTEDQDTAHGFIVAK